MRITRAIVVWTLLCGAAVSGQDLPDALLARQQLDRLVEVRFDGTLDQAIEQLSRQTGVAIRLSADAADLLPAGPLTPVRGVFEQVTFRQLLEDMCEGLCLEWTLDPAGGVLLRPLPPLLRIGQPATGAELALIQTLRVTPLPGERLPTTLVEVIAAVDEALLLVDQSRREQGLAVLRAGVENRTREVVPPTQPVHLSRRDTLYDALVQIERQTPLSWYPWGDSVIILPKRDQHDRLLDTLVTLNRPDESVGELLDELSRRSRVRFVYDPGVLQRLRPQQQRVSVNVRDASVRDVLGAIQRQTDLAWSVDEQGVRITPRDRLVALIPIEGGLLVPLTETQLTPELRSRIEQQTEAFLRALGEPGVEPSPAPGPGRDADP